MYLWAGGVAPALIDAAERNSVTVGWLVKKRSVQCAYHSIMMSVFETIHIVTN
jgi:hypothetical protein